MIELAAYPYIYPFNSRLICALAMSLEFRINYRCKTIAFVLVAWSPDFEKQNNAISTVENAQANSF